MHGEDVQITRMNICAKHSKLLLLENRKGGRPTITSEKDRLLLYILARELAFSERYPERPSLTLYDLQIQNIIESIRP